MQTLLPDSRIVCLLEEGCRELGLPTRAATALTQFLTIKRIHDGLIPPISMSAGVVLEELWCWMLLNTAGERLSSQLAQPASLTLHF
jgi:hypothetical protein